MNGAERFVGLLGTLMVRRERENAPVRTARVLGRHEDGTERLQRTDAACVTRAARDNHYAGTVVVEPKLAAFHRSGSTGIGMLTEVAQADTLWIERLDPADYQPGQSYTVTVTGRGFDDRVQIDFLLPPPPYVSGTSIHPDIEVLSIEVLNPETLSLQIAVADGARLVTQRAPIAYGRKR